VRYVLTDDALIVADNGSGFGDEQVRAICGLGRSSKDPRKSIGYKGLGFKSVGEITHRPQIISSEVAFEFDEQRVRDVVQHLVGSIDANQRLPVYAFPFEINEANSDQDSSEIGALRQEGFTTILRLPFKAGVNRADVENQLIECLVPRLLLFLVGIEDLELRGTKSDFTSVVSREGLEDHYEVLLETNGNIEHWLVYRKWHDIEHELVEPLGDAWAEVERVQVAFAVPLDSSGRPSTGTLYPIHVYFPTEERTGLPVIVHGDFALQLDRRQLGSNPEAMPYNERLLDVAAEFVAESVGPALLARYPNDVSAVAALAPRSSATGMGQIFIDRCITALRTSRFLPTVDGNPRTSIEALLLPADVPDAARLEHHLDLSHFGHLLIPQTEADAFVRTFLKEQLGVEEWTLAGVLDELTRPADDQLIDFYDVLVEWAEDVGTRRFGARLAQIPCVATTTGEWVAPADGKAFFPRQRDDVEVPADLPVPIASLPPVDGLTELLAVAGVRDFEWRELMRDYLLPLLISQETGEETRKRAMRGLRAYYASQRTGDPQLQRRIRDVLLPACSADGSVRRLSRAGSLYFTVSWTGSRTLETLYGPFEQVEFLSIGLPENVEDRDSDAEFFRWLGVDGHPKVVDVRTDQRDTFMLGSSWIRHPHRSLPGWSDWWSSPEVMEAQDCGQNHPASQQLRVSCALDRFDEIVAIGDPARLVTLWNELAQNWGRIYEPACVAVFHCQNSAHGGERDRNSPSLLWHQLTQLPWVPTLKGRAMELVPPSSAWRLALDTPRWVARRVPLLDARMLEGAGIRLATALAVTDAARPEPADLCLLLKQLRDENEASGGTVKEIHTAARWAMRTLNDVLVDQSDSTVLEGVPLLARFKGEIVFTTRPVVSVDPLLEEAWEPFYPILDADRDLRRLHEALNLVVLDDPTRGVQVSPIAKGLREDIQRATERRLQRTKPFLAAVAIANTPSREDDVLRGLRRLEVSACTNLVLRYSFDGRILDREEATSYIAVRQEALRGAARRNIGTAYLEVSSESGEADWYMFGPQLAQFLQVPTQGDAFAVLLTGSEADCLRYLTSRRIPLSAVDQMRDALELPPEDELPDDLWDFLGSDGDSEGGYGHDNFEESEWPADSEDTRNQSPGEQTEAPDEPLPEIDPEGITMEDVDVDVQPVDQRGGGGGGGGFGPAGPVDHERTAKRQREIGQRGEIAAVEAERRRLAAAGLNPEAVVWRSELHPFAPHDIESVDADGQRIFIEVKATTGSDPGEPFLISQSELLEALRHRSRYYIYRVTKANTATPSIHRYRDPVSLLTEGMAQLRVSDARMKLGEQRTAEEPAP